jgi:hypothetical protein
MRFFQTLKLVLTLRCRQASWLLSRSQDDSLDPAERMAVRFHLLICRSCRRFSHQLIMLRQALRTFCVRPHEDDASTAFSSADRERFLKKLARALRKK